MLVQMAFPGTTRKLKFLNRSSVLVRDGRLDISPGVQLGYCLYRCPEAKGVVLYFHANAELVTDLEGIVHLYKKQQVAVLAMEYRGFGWCHGTPSMATFIPDCEEFLNHLPGILQAENLHELPLVVYGRSLGASLAVHVAAHTPANLHVRGAILESSLMEWATLPLVKQLSQKVPNGSSLLCMLPDPLQTLSKLCKITCPVLVMHGEKDQIIPISQGEQCHAGVASVMKRFKRFPRANHNDLYQTHPHEYAKELAGFFDQVFGNGAYEATSVMEFSQPDSPGWQACIPWFLAGQPSMSNGSSAWSCMSWCQFSDQHPPVAISKR